MTEKLVRKPKLGLVEDSSPIEESKQPTDGSPFAEEPKLESVNEPPPVEEQAELDEDELEYQRLRCDLPGVTGAAAQGIVSISVSRKPIDDEFFRTHPDFRPKFNLISADVGMDKQYFAVDPSMEVPLMGIGKNFSEYTLYMTTSPLGVIRVIPILNETDNEYTRTKEIGLLDGVKKWVRLYTDKADKRYKVFPAPVGRFDEPTWPQLKESKIIRLCFRDKGRLIFDTSHEFFKKWAASDPKKK